ncbi:MAG TPA: hypothetical protein VGL51_05490 [Solirubrobacteraceae bacterium]|jgi:hypothetical protein
MGKVWVLNTETKGTGASVVPLERVTKHRSATDPVLVPREPPPRPPEAPEPRRPRTFRVIDVMSRRALVDDVNLLQTVDALKGVRSVVDIEVYVSRHQDDGWRRLTFSERQALWELTER